MIKIEWADYVSRLGWSELAGVENSGAVCGDWLGCCSWCRRPMSPPPYPMSHAGLSWWWPFGFPMPGRISFAA